MRSLKITPFKKQWKDTKERKTESWVEHSQWTSASALCVWVYSLATTHTGIHPQQQLKPHNGNQPTNKLVHKWNQNLWTSKNKNTTLIIKDSTCSDNIKRVDLLHWFYTGVHLCASSCSLYWWVNRWAGQMDPSLPASDWCRTELVTEIINIPEKNKE